MKTILIPTDFSDNAGDALAYTLKFIGVQPAEIHIINTIDPNISLPSVPSERQDILAEYIQEAENTMTALRGYSKNLLGDENSAKVTVTTHVGVGSIPSNIKNKAKTLKADLIIMGTQGERHTYLEKRIGSISTEVLKNAPCPVILVPRGYDFKPINNLLFTTNLNHGDPYELWRATELLKPHQAIVRCLHVVAKAADKDDEHLEQFAKYMVEHSSSIQTIFDVEVNQDTEAAIVEYANTFDVEMIIMHKAKHSFWQSFFAHSHTKKMAFKLDVPLMVINSEND